MTTTNDAPAQASVATWHPLDENGLAELRVNGKRVTTFPSYPAAEEAAQRINAALSPPLTVGAEDEAPVAWRVRERPGFPWDLLSGDPTRHPKYRGDEIQPLYARPAPAADGLRLPGEMTPAIKDVFGIMLWTSGSLARAYRAGGFDIPTRAEEEQAFVLWRMLRFAIEHGDEWRKVATDDLSSIRACLATDKEGA